MMLSKQDESPAPRSLPKVSVIDDDPDLVAYFKDIAEFGYFELMDSYSTAGEALARLPLRQLDVLFMDLQLPDMSGLECTRRLLTLLPNLRILIITGHPSPSTVLQALVAGARGFLVKPCGAEEIMKTINDVLREDLVFGKTALQHLQRGLRRLRYFLPDFALSEREEQILVCIYQGMEDKEIADELGIGLATVHTHCHRLFHKLGVHSRHDLIAKFLLRE